MLPVGAFAGPFDGAWIDIFGVDVALGPAALESNTS